MAHPLLIALSALLILTVFLAGSRVRLNSLVVLFRAQSLVIAAVFAAAAGVFAEPELAIMAALVFALKVVLIPMLLTRVARTIGVSGRLPTLFLPTAMAFIAALAIGFAAFVALRLPFGESSFFVAAALALVLVGFELLIVHKNLFGQGIGFLVLENGIFFLGFALAHGMPLFIEIGVLADLLALLVIATALIARAHLLHRSVATDYFETLKDL